MVELQVLTGMRPGEACIMRGCDITTPKDKTWSFRPPTHKTAHHGHSRVIDLGPQAREIVARFLKPDLTQYLFSPADAEQARREKLAYARETPLSCGNDAGSNRRGGRTLGARYTVAAYRRAIAARPSMGKSTFMRWTMSGLAIQGTPVSFIHVEENEDKVAGNVLSAESGVENARLD